jgi:hypothetical protein
MKILLNNQGIMLIAKLDYPAVSIHKIILFKHVTTENHINKWEILLRYCPHNKSVHIHIYRVLHKSVNRSCITVYRSFSDFYKVISITEIVQSDLHCYLYI